MSQQTSPAAGRVIGVDVARALALSGMVVAHLIDSTPTETAEVSPWFQLVAGRSAALFAVLAGVSLVMSSRRDGALFPGARQAVATRAMVIAALGLLLGPFGDTAGVAVILTYYGLLFLFALPVLGWSARALALLAGGCAVAAPTLSLLVRENLPWTAPQIPQPQSLLDPAGLLTDLLLTGYYPGLTWATYLFAGMAVGCLDLRRAAVGARLAAGGLVLAGSALVVSRVVLGSPRLARQLLASDDIVGSPDTVDQLRTEVTLGFFGTTPTGSAWWLAVWAPHSGSIVDLAHTTGCAVAVLGGVLMVTGRLNQQSRRLVHLVFGAGTVALTLYAVHVVLLGVLGTYDWAQAISVHVIVLGTLGALLATTPTRGPLEAAVSRIQDLVPVGHRKDRP
ncbi:MAG: heparan-alpha-glucosaminide N-acetyltransferase domain-containing protein [Ornithinimicrobium sp.]